MRRWTAPPTIVAEELVGVPDPLLTALRAGPPASGAAVASSLARSLAPAEHLVPAPPWLLPEQKQSFRRVLAAVLRYGGVVLADPVGSGKTFVSLAVASAVNRGSTACLVPATLLGQWEAAAGRTGVPLTLCSHEQVSRGRLPEGTRGLVIIDESHHFRNRHTRRYSNLAPWLVGRPALLVTATPIVNRLADLVHQLRLAVRDNALAASGIASIRAQVTSGCPAPALGQLVIESEPVIGSRPSSIRRISKPSATECAMMACLIERLGRLRLSRVEPVAALIRGVLLRAAGSSPAALEGALRRYRRLLLHARDALEAGQTMDRAELRRFTGELGDQLIWWELLPTTETETEMEPGDLAELEDLIRAAQAASIGDEKLERLRQILNHGSPTLVFAASRDTVRYIRDRLRDLGLAWCTGERAGIGAAPVARRTVLGWFREPTTSSLAPRHLVVTDVAAEGLDLPRAARVVHYDLPWTPMRLEQREGRSVRYGSPYRQIEVLRFAPPPVLERSLGLEAILARKARLPAAVGLGSDGSPMWRWRAHLAQRFGSGDPRAGVASVPWPEHGLLAGFSIYCQDASETCLSASVLWLDRSGFWTEAPETIAAKLGSAAAQWEITPADTDRLHDWLTLLARPIRERLALTRSRRWCTPDPSQAARRLAARLQGLVRDAARRRQADRLERLEGALAFVAGGHTAGEAMLVERLVKSSDRELAAAVGRLPKTGSEWDGIEVRLTGLVLFGPSRGSGIEAPAPGSSTELASVPCLDCKPLSSTSTGP